MKSIDIYIKSYAKDFGLLRYALMSLKKYVTGYNKLIICIPLDDYLEFHKLFREGSFIDCVVIVNVEYGNRYLYQQVCKLKAYKHSSANYIMFSDSDVIFDRPINLQDYIKGGKPEILHTSWDKVGDAKCWKQCTEKLLGETVDFEFMRRNNLIYHRSTLENIALEYPNLEKDIMASDRASEFNFIGAYAFKKEKKKYRFVNTDNWEYSPPLGTQLWGWAEKDNPQEPHPFEYARSLKIINETLNLNITEL